MSDESKGWYRMTRPLFNSGFEDDEFWAYGQDGFRELLDSTLGADVFIHDKRIQDDPVIVRAIIQNQTSDVFNNTSVRQILCPIGILHCGQYVEYGGTMWMVSTLPDNNRIYEKAVLWKCGHNIRMMSPLTGKIVEYPVVSKNSTQYGTGEQGKVYMTVGEDQHLIYIPYNEETILLDNNFRFLMDKSRENPTAYRITRVDPVSYAVGEDRRDDGLIQWSVIQTQFNERTDDREEMIADYRSDPVSVEGGLTLTDLDGDCTLAVGENKEIRISYILPDGTEGVLPEYRLEYELSDGAASVIGVQDNILTIRASDELCYVGCGIVIRAICDMPVCEASITIRIVNW